MESVAPAIILVVALVFLATGVLTLRDRLPRNRWAGIRLPATMKDDPAWYAAHRAAAVWFIVGGVSALVTTGSYVASDQSEDGLVWATMFGGLVLVVYLAIATIAGLRAASRVERGRRTFGAK